MNDHNIISINSDHISYLRSALASYNIDNPNDKRIKDQELPYLMAEIRRLVSQDTIMATFLKDMENEATWRSFFESLPTIRLY